MQVQAIGVIIVFIAAISCLFNSDYVYITFIVSLVLGSASAVNFGASTIQPAHTLIAFICIITLTNKVLLVNATRLLLPPKPGFWLATAISYGVLGAIFLPRIFEGAFDIVFVGVPANADAGSLAPLAISPISPVSGNVTQSIYLVGDLLCFLLICSKIRSDNSAKLFAFAFMWYATADIILALMDIVTYSTHTGWLMDFMRNAQYGIQSESELGNLKRVAGSFTEASAFSGATLGVLGFTLTLWICNIYSVWSGIIAIASFVFLIMSTSSTGLLGTPVLSIMIYLEALRRYGSLSRCLNSKIFVIYSPLVCMIFYLIISLSPDTSSSIYDYLNQLIFDKSSSASGIERSSWNRTALNAFIDSYGIGVGLGTARASSFVIAILSNLGVFGCTSFLIFIFSSFTFMRGQKWSYNDNIRLAARNGALGVLLGGIISGTLVDLGLMFFVFAAISFTKVITKNQVFIHNSNYYRIKSKITK